MKRGIIALFASLALMCASAVPTAGASYCWEKYVPGHWVWYGHWVYIYGAWHVYCSA